MIKKFLLAVMLIWCAADGMAQERTLLIENYEDDDFYNKTTAVCDIYSDGTAVLKQYQSSDCDYTVSLPTTVSYKEKDYIIEEIADNVFFNDKINDYTINNETWLVTIPDNASSSLKLGATPFGNLTPPSGIELQVSPCVDASNWKEYFSVVQSIPLVDATFETLKTTYEGNKPISLSTPCTVSTSDYTLSITKLQPLNDKGEFWSISAIDFTVIDINNNNTQVCQVKGGNLEIDKEILKVNLADITEITKENLLLETSSKFYPVPTNPDDIVSHVRTGGKPETYSDDYVLCEDNGKKFIPIRGLAETDTLCVECDYNFVCNENGVAVNFSIPSNANIKSNYGPGFHFSSHHYNWTLKLDQDYNCTIPLTDPYPVFVNTTPEDKYEEITGKEPINLSTQKWTDYWFEVDGKRYEHGFFINYNEEDFDYLTKSYDGSTSIEVKGTITLKLKQRFNPTIGAVNRMNSGWLAFDPEAYCIDIETIPITYSIAFDDASAGTNKGITLTITPEDPFYKALLGTNNKITLKGTITPIELDGIDALKDVIRDALADIKDKPYDGTNNLNPNTTLTVNAKKEDTGLPDDVEITLSNLYYYDRTDGKFTEAANCGEHSIAMSLKLEEGGNYCFFSIPKDNTVEYQYNENWYYDDFFKGTIKPQEIKLDSATIAQILVLEKTYDGTTDIQINYEKFFDDNFQIVSAKYSSADVTESGLTPVIVEIKNLTGNYKITNLNQNNSVTVNGKINPAKLDITFTPEDFKENITFQRQYNSEDASAEIKTREFSKNGHNFIITKAIFTDNTPGTNKQIAITIEFKDNNQNYELKNSTFNISGGKIWDYATIALNNNKFAEGKATIGTDIIATATYNGQNIEGTFTYNPAAGTQLTQGTHEITATFTSACDYIESSTQKFTVEVNGSAIIVKEESIQQKDNQTEYCINGVNGLELKYTKISGDINRFKIEIEGEEKLSETMSDNKGERINDTIIYVNIPSDAKPGIYHGNIQFFGDDVVSDKYPFEITVYMPKSIVKYLYHNVIFVDNHENLFSDYQWYKNGEKIDGATRQYYYEKVLDGNYYVVCKTNSGIQLKSCPVEGELSAKLSVSSVKVYPNPAKADIPFNLELVGGNGNYAGAEMMIYNNSGNLVKHITNITDIITLTLPQGNYSGALFFNGEKTGFKIIVK